MYYPTAPPEYAQPPQQQQQQQQQQQVGYPPVDYSQPPMGGYSSQPMQGGYPGQPLYPGGPIAPPPVDYNPYATQQPQHQQPQHHQQPAYPIQQAHGHPPAPMPVQPAVADASADMSSLSLVDPVREKAFIDAKAENEILLQMLDDALCDEQHRKGKKENGLEEKIQFSNVDGTYHSLETTNDWMKNRYKQRRGHMAAKRYAMTDVVDTFSEYLYDAVHSNTVTNAIESNIKQTGYRIVGSLGKKLSRATQKLESAVSGSKVASNIVTGTQQRFGTIEVPEINMFWKEEWESATFGRDMRNKYYNFLEVKSAIDSAGIPVTPACIRAAQIRWDRCNQADPVLWRFKTLPIRVRQAEQAAAELLGVDPNDLKFTLSAEFSVSAILKSLPWQPGDGILSLTLDLSSGIQKCVSSLSKTFGYEIHTLNIPAPSTGEGVQGALKRFCKSLPKGHGIKIAVLSEVGYNTGIKVSIKKMTKYLHNVGISALVDGTHAVGHRDINIAGKGADWYVATLSHWLYTPHGTGIIIAHPLKQPVTNTLTVSYFDRGPMNKTSFTCSFEKEFSYTGLQDFSTWCASIQSFQFIYKICNGLGPIRQYTFKLANQVVTEIKKIWGTSPVQLDAVGALPVFPIPNGGNQSCTLPAVLSLHCALNGFLVRFAMIPLDNVPVVCARFTCQIHNDISEYVEAAQFIASLDYRNISLPHDIDLSAYETI